MDPISIGVAVGTAVLTQVTKKVMEKAADPEKVASGVNWLFLATAHFLRIRKKEVPAQGAIPAPPVAEAVTAAPVISPASVEEKRAAVQEKAESLKAEAIKAAPAEGVVQVKALDDFTANQVAQELTSLLTQLETYLRNLRFEEEKAAQYGGLEFAPVIIMNTARIQKREIGSRLLRLNTAIKKVYGVGAPHIDLLSAVLEE